LATTKYYQEQKLDGFVSWMYKKFNKPPEKGGSVLKAFNFQLPHHYCYHQGIHAHVINRAANNGFFSNVQESLQFSSLSFRNIPQKQHYPTKANALRVDFKLTFFSSFSPFCAS